MSGDHAKINFFQQVIAAVAAADANERGNVITPPEFMKFMHASFHASGKVKIALKNFLRIDRLVSHLAQPVAACQKGVAIEAAGRSDDSDLVTLAQSRRTNGFCRSVDLCVSQEILPGRSVAPGR